MASAMDLIKQSQSRMKLRSTRYFFDRSSVIAAVGKAAAKNLSKAGAYMRRTAKGSIRKAKGPSKPGRPPHSHVGTLKNLLFFSYDPRTRSVVVGPEKVHPGFIPRTLEIGGTQAKRRNARRIIRKLGDGGEIAIGGRPSRNSKVNKEGKLVTYAKLRSGAMVSRANRLQEELYGPLMIGGKHIEARPYMNPALEKNRPAIAGMWANSVI